MEKKELKQITTKIYEEYGFIKKGKYYYLDLPEVLICSGFSTLHEITYLSYNFSVKAVHSQEEIKPNDMFEGFDSWEIQMYFDRNASGYKKKEILYNDWDKEYYANNLKEILHYYFDPYKKDALNHIRRSYKEVGYIHKNEIIMVKIKAKEYLNI